MRNSLKLFAWILIFTVFSFGCATPALWGIKSYIPAQQPAVALAFSPEKHDFLVTYAVSPDSLITSYRTNSYWLLAYADCPPKSHRPSFVENTNVSGLVAVPMFKPDQPVAQTGYSAVAYPVFGTFDLYHEGVDIGRFVLPKYSTERKPANFTRVVLTPPAVIADTAMVGALVGALGIAYGGGVPRF